MGKFKSFFEAIGNRTGDYSHLGLKDRLSIGKNMGEKFIRDALAQHGVNIVPVSNSYADKSLKIDGYLNNEPVQIKLRRTSRDDRNDIAFELLKNHSPGKNLIDQLEEPRRQGRDYIGKVKHYFVLNSQETEIYHVSSAKLRQSVMQSVSEIDQSQLRGVLNQPFKASNGVELRPTRDNDPNNRFFSQNKVMAFVPVAAVSDQTYRIKPTYAGGGSIEQPTKQVGVA